jgi:hypothetical protein
LLTCSTGCDWDSITVVQPYSNVRDLDTLGYDNFRKIVNLIHKVSLAEWHYTVIFTRKHSITGYAILPSKFPLTILHLSSFRPTIIKKSESVFIMSRKLEPDSTKQFFLWPAGRIAKAISVSIGDSIVPFWGFDVGYNRGIISPQ